MVTNPELIPARSIRNGNKYPTDLKTDYRQNENIRGARIGGTPLTAQTACPIWSYEVLFRSLVNRTWATEGILKILIPRVITALVEIKIWTVQGFRTEFCTDSIFPVPTSSIG